MTKNFRGGFFDLDALPAAMTKFEQQPSSAKSWGALAGGRLPQRGGAVGSWSVTPGDPLAEVLVVRDENFQDILNWLNSFFAGLSPVTQWCRVLPQSVAERMAVRTDAVGLGRMLGPWVGAVLAECSVQAGGLQSLRDMPGSAAASSATFAAGRAEAIWNQENNFTEIARRHDDLSHSLRDGSRPLAAQELIPLWTVLGGRIETLNSSDRRTLGPLIDILSEVASDSGPLEPAEVVKKVSQLARDYFNVPELADCAVGPQVERVRALDRLGQTLASGPKSPVIEALLGLGASFIDPGSAVAPELLRRYGQQLPVAPIWQGVFAGALSPLRVMTDQHGLGRLVAKTLLASDDLEGRPTCDIAYEELVRWITPGRSLKLDMRGMSARVLSVELMTGVTCAFSFGRLEPTLAIAHPKMESTRTPDQRSRSLGRSVQELDVVVMNLQQRIERLEAQKSSGQRSLDLPEPKEGKPRRGLREKS